MYYFLQIFNNVKHNITQNECGDILFTYKRVATRSFTEIGIRILLFVRPGQDRIQVYDHIEQVSFVSY